MAAEATTRTSPTWTRAWSPGEALLWRHRDDSGLHVLVMVEEPVIGPRGGLRKGGVMAEICGPTLASVNRALRDLGLGPVRHRLRDIGFAA